MAAPPEYEHETTRNTAVLSISPERRAKDERLVAEWQPNRLNVRSKHSNPATEAMSALGQKRTSRDLAIYVRYWGQSGHWQVPDPES